MSLGFEVSDTLRYLARVLRNDFHGNLQNFLLKNVFDKRNSEIFAANQISEIFFYSFRVFLLSYNWETFINFAVLGSKVFAVLQRDNRRYCRLLSHEF